MTKRTEAGIERERARRATSETERARKREAARRRRAALGDDRVRAADEARRTAVADAFDAAFATKRTAIRLARRVIVAAPHECAAHGAVMFVDSRPPRGERWRARDIVRADTFDSRPRFGALHACEHVGGHVRTRPSAPPMLSWWRTRVIDVAASMTPGHDPAFANVERSRGERWARERAAHEADCGDCKTARRGVTPATTKRVDDAPEHSPRAWAAIERTAIVARRINRASTPAAARWRASGAVVRTPAQRAATASTARSWAIVGAFVFVSDGRTRRIVGRADTMTTDALRAALRRA